MTATEGIRYILAVDPGPKESGILVLEAAPKIVVYAATLLNESALYEIARRVGFNTMLAVEQVASYGMAVGEEVFSTCLWAGRFIQRWHDAARDGDLAHWCLIPRLRVKMALCYSARAKDADLRQRLIDLYGGKETAKGNKAHPGPLYEVKGHLWAALALAWCWCEEQKALQMAEATP